MPDKPTPIQQARRYERSAKIRLQVIRELKALLEVGRYSDAENRAAEFIEFLEKQSRTQ